MSTILRKQVLFLLIIIVLQSCIRKDKPAAREKSLIENNRNVSSTNPPGQDVFKKVATKLDTVNKKNSPPEQENGSRNNFAVKSILDDRLRLSIPQGFTIMDEAIVRLKYPRLSQNSIVYSNEKSTVSIAVGLTDHQSTQAQLPNIKRALDEQYSRASIELNSSKIEKVNGRDFIIMEFTSSAVDGLIYNLMFITSIEDRLLIGTFNCIQSLQDIWEPKGKTMVNSIKI